MDLLDKFIETIKQQQSFDKDTVVLHKKDLVLFLESVNYAFFCLNEDKENILMQLEEVEDYLTCDEYELPLGTVRFSCDNMSIKTKFENFIEREMRRELF